MLQLCFFNMDFTNCLHDSIALVRLPEIIAVVTGVASVWFARKENILVFPVGIISVLLYVYICLHVKLYADALINFYYFVMSVYGWYFWKHGGKEQGRSARPPEKEIDSSFLQEEAPLTEKEEAEIGYNTLVANIWFLSLTVILGIVIGYLLDSFTDSNVPYWDGITTAIFCIAMVLMARKKIENWIYWLLGDALCIPLFLYKGLCFSSLQYAIFTVLAIMGYWSWRNTLKKKISAA